MLPLVIAVAVLASNPTPPSRAEKAKAEAAKPGAKSADGKLDGAACHHPPVAEQGSPSGGWTLHRGEKIAEGKAVPVAELLASAAKHDGKTLIVEGTVRKACSRKGCWMELAADGNATGAGVRVTFKDYGFFVPLDSAGSKARVAGAVKLAQLSEERAKHYESEGAVVPRDASGTPREVQVVATGVELRR